MGPPWYRFLFFFSVAIIIIIYFYRNNGDRNFIGRAIAEKYYETWNDINGQPVVHLSEILKGPLPQNDTRILDIIRQNYLNPPSAEPYNLIKPDIDPSMGQSQVIKQFYEFKTQGVFVECGGYDGETRSNTLSLEKDLGWSGILIEGGENNFQTLKTKNRKAWSINSCLSIFPYPHEVFFSDAKNVGKISKTNSGKATQCFPLYSILAAAGINSVDYFSLDVEGNELDVLKTIPFDKIFIKVLSVEFFHTPGGGNQPDVIVEYMKKQGFTAITRVINPHHLAHDVILVHNSILPKQNPFPPIIHS